MIGSTTIDSGTTMDTQADHRLALLTARTGLEPELAQRYTNDPLQVLAEFGLASEPVYLEGQPGRPPGLFVEELDGPGGAVASFCNFTHSPVASFCNFTHAPVASFCNFTHGPVPGRS